MLHKPMDLVQVCSTLENMRASVRDRRNWPPLSDALRILFSPQLGHSHNKEECTSLPTHVVLHRHKQSELSFEQSAPCTAHFMSSVAPKCAYQNIELITLQKAIVFMAFPFVQWFRLFDKTQIFFSFVI